jgi:predicted hotdog family 3-hydroxylacyl-ACP dehydratase
MRLDRAWIEEHIPHKGRMCLWDEVLDWDMDRIRCRSETHRNADNPLMGHGRLGIASGVEYAAQAMAVHGALTGAALNSLAKPAAGFLASLRALHLHATRLDDLPDDLLCIAVRVAGDRSTALYEFELRSATACLLSGRATVVLDATSLLPVS